MFKSAWDAAWPVYAIGIALIIVFSTLLKTDERRSSVMLWDWSANPKRHKSPICPGRAVGVEHRSPAFQLEQSIPARSWLTTPDQQSRHSSVARAFISGSDPELAFSRKAGC